MKKLVPVFILFCLSLLFCGCAKHDTSIEIDKFSNINISTTSLMNIQKIVDKSMGSGNESLKSMLKNNITTGIKTQLEAQKDSLSNAKIIDDGTNIGLSATKSFDAKEGVFLPNGYESENPSLAVCEEKLNGVTCNIALKINMDEVYHIDKFDVRKKQDENGELIFDREKNGGDLSFKLSIKTPYKAFETNATQRDDINYVYTWEYKSVDKQIYDIKLEYGRKNNVLIYVICVFLIIILISKLQRKEKIDYD